MPEVTILLPAFNPAPGWENLVIHRFGTLQKNLSDLTFQLILINDGSTLPAWSSGVNKVIEAFPNTHVINNDVNRGKGYALREGIKKSNGDINLYTDIDWPYTDASMIHMIRLLEDGAEVAVGVRNNAYHQQLPAMRKKISLWLKKINARLLHLKVDDTQAGLKGFRRTMNEVFLSTSINRYLFDLEFIYLLSKKNINVMPVPIELRPGIVFSKMNRKVILIEGWNFIRIWMRGARTN